MKPIRLPEPLYDALVDLEVYFDSENQSNAKIELTKAKEEACGCACVLSGIALFEAFDVFTRSIKFYISGLFETTETQAGDAVSNVLETDKKQDLLKEKEKPSKKKKKKEKVIVEVEKNEKKRPLILPVDTSIFALFLIVLLATFYVVHSVWAAAKTYSAPSIVLTSRSPEGLHVFDDFREAYAWLSHNTHVNDKVASWWDYGYQTTAMANRTVIVDILLDKLGNILEAVDGAESVDGDCDTMWS
ncbi:hypothetical protein L2E82_45336 [Cichorium intybus]|uniref:Uncharacterized protein n=1 Tax=Cichorium intybus TaxID=13427 RepID=A0ACB8ZSK6_CICIN|nr:hypothetical protein L2E82_45336 [Cichorium intybus]